MFGDAICSFNPIYGQGMTSAVLQAEALDACLAAGRERLAPRFFAAAAKVIDTPWQMAAGADLGHPAFAGKAGAMQKLMNRYIIRLQRSAAQDASLSTAFLTAANLLAKPSRLFAPSVVWAVAKVAWPTRQKSSMRAVRPRQLTWDPSGNRQILAPRRLFGSAGVLACTLNPGTSGRGGRGRLLSREVAPLSANRCAGLRR